MLGSVFTKLFSIRSVLKAYYDYLTIDCWCLIKYVLQTRLLGILSFFMKEKVNRYENLNPLNNRISFIIVDCLLHILIMHFNMNFNPMHLRSQTTFTMSMYTQIKFA